LIINSTGSTFTVTLNSPVDTNLAESVTTR
jgi:hypothetical protein